MIGDHYIFVGRINPERKGQRCILEQTWRGRHTKHNVRVRFIDDGWPMICPMRCLRRLKESEVADE